MTQITIGFVGPVRDLNAFLFDLFEANSLQEGTRKDVPGGATLRLLRM